ncbi:MAG: hypothetical protein ACJ735_11590 [Actinomycetes bacterium]
MTPAITKTLVAVLGIVGVLAIIAGVMYVALEVHSLPSFFPGHGAGTFHRPKRGYAGIILGALLLAAAVAVWFTDRRRSSYDA